MGSLPATLFGRWEEESSSLPQTGNTESCPSGPPCWKWLCAFLLQGSTAGACPHSFAAVPVDCSVFLQRPLHLPHSMPGKAAGLVRESSWQFPLLSLESLEGGMPENLPILLFLFSPALRAAPPWNFSGTFSNCLQRPTAASSPAAPGAFPEAPTLSTPADPDCLKGPSCGASWREISPHLLQPRFLSASQPPPKSAHAALGK